MLDVGDLEETAVGDEVTLIGRDGVEEILCDELASAIGTIPYEITCGLGRRVKRIYSEDVGVAQLSGVSTQLSEMSRPSDLKLGA